MIHKTVYHYVTVRAAEAAECLQYQSNPDAYITGDLASNALADLINRGYRWVHTVGEWAVFERQLDFQSQGLHWRFGRPGKHCKP